jgi:hypothetical protein
MDIDNINDELISRSLYYRRSFSRKEQQTKAKTIKRPLDNNKKYKMLKTLVNSRSLDL